jgi:ergothioneine biosynthesis protein EgtB
MLADMMERRPSAPLIDRYRHTRQQSLAACDPLAIEDFGLQAEAFTSPPKWHIAHTSWFFETFLLQPFLEDYRPLEAAYAVLFNSYYNAVGEQFPRPRRGLLSRPTVAEVMAYRRHVDRHMTDLLAQEQHPQRRQIELRCRLGIEHEQQHQELFFTDLKYSLFHNPLLPAYRASDPRAAKPFRSLAWHGFGGGLVEIGHDGAGFAFDNEAPRHRVYLAPYELGDRLVTNAEYQRFIDDGGYHRAELWLADGWTARQESQWQCPHYWLQGQSGWQEYTLHGLRNLEPAQPVCHLSAYEADAYARWAGCRLPTEAEWEHASANEPVMGRAVDDGDYQPRAAAEHSGMKQLYGECWQWTSSAYAPYPGFMAAAGAIGEYNGKFMCNQLVLRGSSCVTGQGHTRPSYRNFFYPGDRWQFSGLRLARTL